MRGGAVVEPLLDSLAGQTPPIDSERVERLTPTSCLSPLQVSPGGSVVGFVTRVELASPAAWRDVSAAWVIRTHVRIVASLLRQDLWHTLAM
jgi:hypothetical protein